MPKKKINISGVSEGFSKSITEDISLEEKQLTLPLRKRKIGISVSESDDYKERGFSKIHQKDLTIELTRYLLVNGAHMVYGGDLRLDGYTLAFSELAFQYRDKGEPAKNYYTNYFGWPLHLNLKNSDEATFKRNRVEIVKVDCTNDVPVKKRKTFLPSDSIEHRFYWAQAMSKMRYEMNKSCDGRVVIGGMLSEYSGYYPGIIEEAYLAAQSKQRLYLLGAFGGATDFIIRAIQGESLSRLNAELLECNPSLKELHEYAKKKKVKVDTEAFLKNFQKLGIKGLSKLNNLTIHENERLFDTKYSHEMVYQVLRGLNK